MSDKKEDKNNANLPVVDCQDVKKAGILKKLKTMKKKYFVLRTESKSGPARLEYYDNEKKFKTGVAAKRSIPIKTCFNINRKVDAKHKFAITLYTKDDSFSVVADTEESVEEWLNAMLELQLDVPCSGGAKLKPKFAHVWQVNVGEKSLAFSKNIKGVYRLCLTASMLTLVKVDQSDPPETLEFSLMSVRRCGHTNNYFLIELGRSSVTGAGELWLETEDVVIAQNMHEVTLKYVNAMKASREREESFGPFLRPRSSSNSENSRPITSRPRPVAVVNPQAYVRDRCDSLPSRPRTISEGHEANRSYYAPQFHMDSLRPYGGYSRTVSYSPPTQNPLSPLSATCSNDSAGSSHSIDEFDGCQQTDFAHGRYIHSLPTEGALHTEPPIKEEQLDDYVPMTIGNNNIDNNTEGYLTMDYSISPSACSSFFLHLNSSVDSAHTSSLPPTSNSNDYMEMKSPMADGYINMSPVGANLDVQSSSPCDSFLNDSSQTNDGYIHMAPIHNHGASPQQHEGYLDMAPLSSSLPKTFSVLANQAINLPSRKDSNSKLSDTAASTPSSSNLEDFPLDKVKSFLSDADDASFDSYIRPVRAYSMGSRPQPKKSHLSLQAHEGSRTRAYSVGSQASSQRKISNPIDREIGNMKIDPRTGAKSSCSPLLNNRPPRIHSSASRGDIGEDLMEIDYNKTKYSTGIDLSDSYTIEPVGRARSGSYSSSSNNALKLLHNRDKIKSQSIGHSSGSVKDDADNNDYLSMSPLTDQDKSRKNSCSMSKNDLFSKKLDILHPPGDYVSLDPSCTYTSRDKYLTGANNNGSPLNQNSVNCFITSPLSKASACNNVDKTSASNKESVNGEIITNNNSPQKMKKQPSSDYMCMSFEQNSESRESSSKVLLLPNSHSLHSVSNSNREECDSSTIKNAMQDKQLQPVSPSSKTSPVKNFVPKTPPPSPSYGPSATSFSSLQIVDNVVRRLSQPTNTSAVQSAPNFGEICLNYASLDLPPASDEDGRGTATKLKKSAEDEAQDGLTYAQIDFSLVRQKSLQEPESLSHL